MHNVQLINRENARTLNLQDYNDLWAKLILSKFLKNVLKSYFSLERQSLVCTDYESLDQHLVSVILVHLYQNLHLLHGQHQIEN